MPLIQLHWQWIKNGKSIKNEMRAQRDVNSQEEMNAFFNETRDRHPLAKGAQWLCCTEESRFFEKIAGENPT
jgi:hypothetical protein